MGTCIALYVIGVGITILACAGALAMFSPAYEDWEKDYQRAAAKSLLLAPVWPVLVIWWITGAIKAAWVITGWGVDGKG